MPPAAAAAPPVDTRPIESEIAPALAAARGLAVLDPASYALAGQELVRLATAERRIADWFRPLRDAAHKAWKVLCDREREVLTPLTQEIARLKRERVTWKAADDQRRRDEERRLADAEKRRAEEAAAAKAKQLEDRGQVAQAAQVLERAIAAPPPAVVLPDSTPKVAGISARKVWRFRVVDEALVPREFLKVDDVKVGQYVRAMKSTGAIAGIEIYSEDDESVRRM
jgi:hypothetical protein